MGAKAAAVAKWMWTVMFALVFIATWFAVGFCASGGADWEVGIFLIPHLSWGGPNWEFWAHTPIIKLTYLSHFAVFVLGRS